MSSPDGDALNEAQFSAFLNFMAEFNVIVASPLEQDAARWALYAEDGNFDRALAAYERNIDGDLDHNFRLIKEN